MRAWRMPLFGTCSRMTRTPLRGVKRQRLAWFKSLSLQGGAPLQLACRSAGLQLIASMGSALSSGTSAKPVKAMYSASIPIIGLHPGASCNGLSAPPRRSQRRSNDLIGGVCRPVPEPKDRDCTTGATSNWPISKAKNLTITAKPFGHEAC